MFQREKNLILPLKKGRSLITLNKLIKIFPYATRKQILQLDQKKDRFDTIVNTNCLVQRQKRYLSPLMYILTNFSVWQTIDWDYLLYVFSNGYSFNSFIIRYCFPYFNDFQITSKELSANPYLFLFVVRFDCSQIVDCSISYCKSITIVCK